MIGVIGDDRNIAAEIAELFVHGVGFERTQSLQEMDSNLMADVF